MKKPIRVLQVVGDSKYGGATYLILSWCRFLIDKGCEVTVLSTDRTTISKFEDQGINTISSVMIPRDVSVIQDAKALIQFIKLCENNNYDVVHTHTSTPGFIGRLASWITKVPVRLHTAHGWPVTEFSNLGEKLFFTPFEYLAGLLSSRVICVSRATEEFAIRSHLSPKSKLVTILNGLDHEPFVASVENEKGKHIRDSLGIKGEQIVIGNIGRLAPQKDNETLIRAMYDLKEILPNQPFTLILAGDGPDRAKLERFSLSLELEDRVRFIGFYKDIPELLSAIDIFVSPSLWEGLSISLMEAMASARPIVTTEIPPNAELIKHEATGLLIPVKSPHELAFAIKRLIENPTLAENCGRKAQKLVFERYTIDRMFEETWDLYKSAIADSRLRKSDEKRSFQTE